ncbi:F-box-like domain protein [Ceratobasidium sp. AG-Ba]|nr:F-box-like domain protein [Ceratobasidium sp. AG-Ba]
MELQTSSGSYQHRNSLADRLEGSSIKPAHIDLLPDELLLNILEIVVFEDLWDVLVVLKEPVVGEDGVVCLPDYPERLSRVCWLWRKLIMRACVLWSYIDVIASGPLAQKSYNRACYFIQRAADAPLFVRVHETTPCESHETKRLAAWLQPLFKQIYSLDVTEGFSSPSLAIIFSVLDTWFEYGTPGGVKELSLECTQDFRQPQFINSASTSSPADWNFSISSELLERFLEPITLLRLDGVHAHWGTRAYRGLTHLQLAGGEIQETDLLNILSHNQHLRTLSFGLSVVERRSEHILPFPVRLPDLRILNIEMARMTEIWDTLRFIAPGPQPLSLALGFDEDDSSQDTIKSAQGRAFFQRSNVTKCHVRMDPEILQLKWFPELLGEVPRLRTLCLQEGKLIGNYSMNHNGNLQNRRSSPDLRELCIFDCVIDHDEFKQLLHTHSIEVLRIAGCRILSDGLKAIKSIHEVETELSGLVPDVRCYEEMIYDPRDPRTIWDYAYF